MRCQLVIAEKTHSTLKVFICGANIIIYVFLSINHTNILLIEVKLKIRCLLYIIDCSGVNVTCSSRVRQKNVYELSSRSFVRLMLFIHCTIANRQRRRLLDQVSRYLYILALNFKIKTEKTSLQQGAVKRRPRYKVYNI